MTRIITGVIIILTFKLNVIQDHAKNMRANVEQLLLRPPYHRSRTSATMNYEHDTIHHSRQNRSVCKRNRRWRIDYNVAKTLTEDSQQLAHFIRTQKFRRVRRHWSGRKELEVWLRRQGLHQTINVSFTRKPVSQALCIWSIKMSMQSRPSQVAIHHQNFNAGLRQHKGGIDCSGRL